MLNGKDTQIEKYTNCVEIILKTNFIVFLFVLYIRISVVQLIRQHNLINPFVCKLIQLLNTNSIMELCNLDKYMNRAF